MEIVELGRKVIHISSLFIVVFYYMLGKERTLLILTFLLLIFLIAEYTRIELGVKIPIFWRFFREEEKVRLGGEVYFLLGAIISISIFPKAIASASILMTTFGDPAAALVGKSVGRLGIRRKTLEGTLVEFLIDLLIGLKLVGSFGIALGMAGVASIVEASTDKLDDNLLIPIFAGSFGFVIQSFVF